MEKKVSKEILKKNSAESVFDDDKMGFQGKENILKLFLGRNMKLQICLEEEAVQIYD